MRFVRRLLAVAAVLVAVTWVGGYFWLVGSLPETKGRVRTPGIHKTAVVLRDDKGVPHISAATQYDAYFGLGYAHAQDRLWQMETMRRVGQGRLAEIFGTTTLPTDKLMRTLGLYRLAEEQAKTAKEPLKEALEAYSAGVNAWMNNHTGALPPEFVVLHHRPEPWRPADSLVWGKIMGLALSGNWRDELLRARLSRVLPREKVDELWPGNTADPAPNLSGLDDQVLERLAALIPDPAPASNAWVLGGTRTESGKPILANDPHLGYGAPILWYLARIVTPTWRISGATVPGVPLMIVGHNQSIAWGMSTTQSDVADIFVEKVDPQDASHYLTATGSRPFAVREEIIHVRDSADVPLVIRETYHGPVVSDVVREAEGIEEDEDQGPTVLALSATFLAPEDTTADAVYDLNHAADTRAVADALIRYQTPQQTVSYADVEGNIGYAAAGRVPLRQAGEGRYPRPGWTGEFDWKGFVPPQQLPRGYNPKTGLIINANHDITPKNYPHFLGADWDAPYRAMRIEEMNKGDTPLSTRAVASQQMDAVSLMPRHLLPLMIMPAKRSELTGAREREVLTMLEAWTGGMDRDRPEPLIFSAWMRELVRTLVADEIGGVVGEYWGLRPRMVVSILTDKQHWCDDVRTTDAAETCRDQLAVSLSRALDQLESRYGTDISAWQWGSAHVARFNHPLFTRMPFLDLVTDLWIPIDGGIYTVNAGTFPASDSDEPFVSNHGPGLRVVFDLSDLSKSLFVIATGQSGNPLSSHYDSLLKDWRDGTMIRLRPPRQGRPLALLPEGSDD